MRSNAQQETHTAMTNRQNRLSNTQIQCVTKQTHQLTTVKLGSVMNELTQLAIAAAILEKQLCATKVAAVNCNE